MVVVESEKTLLIELHAELMEEVKTPPKEFNFV